MCKDVKLQRVALIVSVGCVFQLHLTPTTGAEDEMQFIVNFS